MDNYTLYKTIVYIAGFLFFIIVALLREVGIIQVRGPALQSALSLRKRDVGSQQFTAEHLYQYLVLHMD